MEILIGILRPLIFSSMANSSECPSTSSFLPNPFLRKKILEFEYIKAEAPRKEEEPSLHDDWVSSVDGSDPRFIVTGCYGSLARVWKAAGECTHILEGHSDVIASVGVINRKGVQGIAVATASKDRIGKSQ